MVSETISTLSSNSKSIINHNGWPIDDGDSLVELPHEEITTLIKIYEDRQPYTCMAYNFLLTIRNWNKVKPNNGFVRLYVPRGVNYKEDGTFLAIIECSSYDLFTFTLNPNPMLVYDCLRDTKKIDWDNKSVVFLGMHKSIYQDIIWSLRSALLPVFYDRECITYYLDKEKAMKFRIECPANYTLKPLRPSDAGYINSHWPHKFNGSDKYFANLIELNGSYGIFDVTTNRLVSWCIINQLGLLTSLQTLDEYKRAGLAALVVKACSKMLATRGMDSTAVILTHNLPSRALFEKIGFRAVGRCNYFTSGQEDVMYTKQHNKMLDAMDVMRKQGIQWD